ncbi:PQQ-binding-like beta-propeller repeat protein [Blastopirellula marina]|uniref:Pyrrolo-quinoline quinone repeat domain-containing protein n=1 Tax=Blastopirellula marina TaxID=124 RepID=A0A2S8GEV9_9BACT|nr:PQQ-binding-like beta-propeller repeat protein [Blastopirellula marina]PQO42634.1 hypothetical protein C5Y98_02000 [Blastopirellula marina]PTL46400.1 hypothetical protein C5Y97_02000 [Blastopirellula marina]
MNDQQLIELVQESPIEDFTLPQIQLLRERIVESPELRTALADRLRMDHHLADVLGSSDDTSDQFVQKLLKRKQRQISRSRWSIGLGLSVLVLLGLTIAGLVNFSGNAPPANTLAQSDSPSPEKPSETIESATEGETADIPPVAPPEPATSPAASEALSPAEANEPPPAETTPNPIEESPAPQEPEGLVPPAIEPISFAHLTSLPDAARYDSLTRSQFDQWFVRASEDLPGEVEEFRDGDHPQIRLKGWFRLRGPLPAGTVLRFAVSDLDKLRFHFYCGDTGVSVVKYRHDYNPWYAYAMQRGEDGVQPRGLVLEANDSYREQRSNARHYQPVAIYFDDTTSELVIYRGDAEVIRTPLPGNPDQIYFEGESIVRQMNLWPIDEFPAPQSPEYPAQVTIDKPAELPWEEKLAKNATLEKNADGSVSLVIDSPDNHSWACVPLPGYGMRMVDLELSHVDRSFAIFLTRHDQPPAEGKPQEIPPPRDGVVFGRNRRTENLYARFSYPFDGNMETDRNVWESPSTEVGDHVWLRLFQGGGQIKGWISRDGIHWALLSSEANNAKEYYDYLGIGAARVEGERHLTIQKIVVRELPTLTGLFPESHWRQVDQIPWKQLENSSRRTESYTLPEGTSLAPDLATALRRYTGKDLSLEGTIALCEEAMQGKTPEQQQAIVNEILALTKTWPLEYNQKRFLTWSRDRLGEIYIDQLYTPNRQDVAQFRRRIFNLPTMNRDPQEYLAREQVNAELLAAIEQERWADVLFHCETIQRYYSYDRNRARRDFPILNWAGGIAVRHAGRLVESQDYLTEGRLTSMLVEDLSKEAYNISADLNAALESGAIEDACRLITQIPESAVAGLAPSGSDPDHFFSIPAAIQMAVQNHQDLRQQMQAKHSDLAQLRLNAAIQRGDRQVIQLVTLQFFDTAAAAQAHLWLGDQATAAGNFATSLQHYLKASRSATGTLRSEVDARIMMLGHVPPDGQEVPSGELAIGTTTLAARSLVDQTSGLRHSIPASDSVPHTDAPAISSPAWPESPWQPTELRWNGMWGNEKDRPPTAIREENTDWRRRDVAITLVQDQAFLSNRFELIKLDLTQRKLLWQQGERDQARGKAHDFPFTRTVPLVVGDLVLCRMLHEKGFALYAFDRETGAPRWASNLEGQMVLATDPIAVQGRVLIVTLKELAQATHAVRLSHVDLATGEIIDSSDLFRIRDTWFDRGIGKIVQHQEQLLIDLGGVLASCDISGYLQWVRKQVTFPQAIDNRWAKQKLSDLVIVGDRAISFHAGCMRIECFDIATGHLNWTLPAVTVQRVERFDDQTVLVEDAHTWKLVAVADGQQKHEIAKPAGLLGSIRAGDALTAFTFQKPQEKDVQPLLQAIRLPLSGDPPTELQTLELGGDKTPSVGPSFYGDGRWHFWFSEDKDSDQRQLFSVD